MADQDPLKDLGFAPPSNQAVPTQQDPLSSLGFSTGAATAPAASLAPSADPLASLGFGGAKPASRPETESTSTSLVGKAWDWANTPLLDLHRSGATNGLELGAEDVASGFTSPLSIGLAVGTAGFAPAATAILKGLGVAEKIIPIAAKGIEALIGAGFTGQQAYQVVHESPRVLDALKEGDYETAKRLGINVLAGGVFSVLGGRHALHDAGELAENVGWKVKPTEEVQKFRREGGVYQADITQAGQTAKLFEENLRKQLGKTDPVRLGAIYHWIEAGGDKTKLQERHDLLSQAAGRTEPVNSSKFSLGSMKTETIQGPEGIVSNDIYPIIQNGRQVGHAVIIKKGNEAFVDWVGDNLERDAEGKSTGRGKLTNILGVPGIRDLARQFKEQNPEIKTLEGMRIGGTATNILKPTSIDLEKLAAEKPVNLSYAPKPVPETGHGMTPDRLAELVQSQKVKEKYTPKEIDNLLDKYKAAMNLTPAEEGLAKQITNSLSEDGELAHNHGVLKNTVKDYLTHIWDLDKDPDNAAANKVIHEANTGAFSTSVSMARQRLFDSAFEGQMLGKHLKTDDPIAIAANYKNSINRAIAARGLLERVRDKFFRASDGRPMVTLAGTGHLVEGSNGENPAVFVNPNRIRSQKISENVISGLQKTGEFDKLISEGKIDTLNPEEMKAGKPGIYGWSGDGYINLDHPAFRDWNFAAHSPEGTPVLVNADLKVHPELAEYMKRFLGIDKSQLRESKVGGMVLRGGARAKGILLSFSPFHLAQEGLRAIMTGINPIGIEKWDLQNDQILRNGVEKGLTLGRDYRSVQDYSEGMGGHDPLLGKIPFGIGKMLDSFQSFLFDKYIPGLKARAYKSLVDRYANKYTDWSPEKVAQEAAAHTNSVFGGINYRQLGRSAAAQDYFRLAALAPDWLESEVRAVSRAFGKEGGIMRQDFARMAGYTWLTARVLNYLTSGDPHNEAPFGVAVKDKDGKEKVYSIRTLPTDMLHMVSDPMGFVRGRFSPYVRAAETLASGRDVRGHRLTPGQMVGEIAGNTLPIPVQAIVKPRQDLTNLDQGFKAAGATVTSYRTEAEKLAGQMATDRSESGPIDRDMLGRHNAKIQFSDDIRSARMNPKDIYDMVHTGQLSLKEGKDIIKEAEMTPLQARFTKLPMKDALEVYKIATDREKAELAKELVKKRNTYIKTAIKDLTPGQRMTDPVYKQLRLLFPSLPPW